ncbi:MAG: flavoprotein [Negativicutes bacterium]|nr:flavoprotein [Negativicutes bacterium]
MTEKIAAARPRIAWGITGAGHFLPQCVDILLQLPDVDVFLSRAAEEVLRDYHLLDRVREAGCCLFREVDASSRAVTRLYTGRYRLVVVAPVSANSMAKMAVGIADTLVTNLFAHAGKTMTPIILLPSDSEAETGSLTPRGDRVQVYMRDVDRQNAALVGRWPGVTVVGGPAELRGALKLES